METQSIAVHNQVRLLFDKLHLHQNYVRVEHEVTSVTHKYLKKMDCTIEENLNDLEVYGCDKANYEGVKDYMKKFFG